MTTNLDLLKSLFFLFLDLVFILFFIFDLQYLIRHD